MPRTLPVVLRREEAARLIAAAPNLKHQAAMSVAYDIGLRVSEIVSLKVRDIIWLAPLRRCEGVVYGLRPFAGPQAVRVNLSRCTHRVAISNSRLIAMDACGVTFKWKDYRVKEGARVGAPVGAGGKSRHKTMTLAPEEFMRRFLLHVLPGRYHRIRHYGLLANDSRKADLALARELLHVVPVQAAAVSSKEQAAAPPNAAPSAFICRHCGQAMIILQTFVRGQAIRGIGLLCPSPGSTRLF